MDIYREIRMVLPGGCMPNRLTLMLWSAGLTPWRYADECGPDFLPRFPMEQLVTWAAGEAYAKLQHDQALARAIERADEILRSQGRTLRVDDVLDAELEAIGNEMLITHPDTAAELAALPQPGESRDAV